MPFQLSPRQQMTAAAAITVLSAVVIIAAVGVLVYLLGLFVQTFSHIFLPVAVAGIAALVLKPYYDWLRGRPFVHPIVALVLVFLSLTLPVVAIGWFFGAIIVEQVTDLLERLPEWWEQASVFLSERWPSVVDFWQNHPWGQRIQTAIETHQQELLTGITDITNRALSYGAGALRGVGVVFSWAVVPVYFAFLLMMDTSGLRGAELLPFLKEKTRNDVLFLAQEFIAIIVAFFRGQFIIAFLQGVLFALGFTIVGLRYGLVLGLLLGFLNIIPYLGSIIGLGVALPLALFQEGGGLWLFAAVIVVFTVVQMIEGYLLTPRIMGGRTGLHPMVIILAVFFWGSALGGILGMILAIPLTAFLVVFWRLVRERYMAEIV